ncbi:MAG: NAD(P)/FAD-dependent oxidoreductase [bacterium]|nr:NAD(P)/FAD-dependent oxidoreductase [bacterium]
MKHVAILGGGPAGAFAAERLASAGLITTLLDEKLAWEKPCGGGLTYKAYSQYPFLIDNDTPKRIIRETYLAAPKTGSHRLSLTQPLVVYSRFDLNRMMLTRAERAGTQIEKTRVLGIHRNGRGWNIRTKQGSLPADYCVVATGARNSLGDVGTRLTAADTLCALGYYVPTSQRHIDVQFLSSLEGYIWVFPRSEHLSVGICGRGEPARALRARLERYLRDKDIPLTGATFYGHMIPSLSPGAWRRNRIAGDGWMAVGDAGGLVDPITGEGLYYAIRSADLASRVVLADEHAPARKATAYRQLIHQDFGADLEFGSRIAKRVYRGSFLFGGVPDRTVQFMRRSPRFRDLMQDLFAGTQPYISLKARLMKNLHGTFREVLLSFFFQRLLQEENRA